MKTGFGASAALLLVLTLLSYSDGSGITATRPLGETEKAKASKEMPKNLCHRLMEIETIPHQVEERGHDPVYDAFMDVGQNASPCLLEAITDTRKMFDPREMPKYSDFRVGDLAFFMFCRIEKAPLEDFLSPRFRKMYRDVNGVAAYFLYVEIKGNREELQLKCRKWLEEKNRKKALPKF